MVVSMNWHTMSPGDTIHALQTDPQRGLNAKQVKERQGKYGKNQLEEAKGKSLLRRFLSQFADFMVIILLIAAVISFITAFLEPDGDFVDPVIILLIVIVNAIIGVVQESRAQRAIDALKKLSAPHAEVIRAGKQQKIDAADLVPGDILLLNTGDLVPADARLLECSSLKMEESSLTGESLPVEKQADARLPEKCALGDQTNCVFSTSTVTAGHARAVVTETGMNTQVGHIAHMINTQEAPQTPLQQRLARVGRILGIGALGICFIIFVLGLFQHVPLLDSFMLSVSLAVAAIPEGLPAIVTIVLSIGVQRMAKSNAIIRRLPAVETLGSATVICSDKTGTLTQNQMTVTRLADIDGPISPSGDRGRNLLALSALCNNAVLEGKPGNFSASGEPTENALVTAAAMQGRLKPTLERSCPRVRELPFDSTRKRMTTIHRLNGGYLVITKGAPDLLLPLCSRILVAGQEQELNAARRMQILRRNDEMAGDALRVMGVAYRQVSSEPGNPERELVFCGLLGMLDPPRKEVWRAVATCKTAGIKPVMITGDHAVTAAAIAKEIGISRDGKVMTGHEIDQLSQEALIRKINDYRVFARVSPEHKVRIVKAFQATGEIVAMTGDGVNDAPALKAADIGCAMGKSGTDVAKSAADMILTDDNFATIVRAVEQGRGIYDNIRKAVHFLLSCNIGEILVIFIASLMGLPAPLLPIQLLWVNLVTDSLPAMALGVEAVDRDIMHRRPVPPKQSLFAQGLGFDIAVEGMMVGALALLAYMLGRTVFPSSGTVLGRTMAFAVLSLSQLVHAFNTRSEHSLFSVGFLSNPKMVISFLICTLMQFSVIAIGPLGALFKTVPLDGMQWLAVAALSLTPLVTVEIGKRMKPADR